MRERFLQAPPLRLADQEAGREQVARAGRVDDAGADPGDRHRDPAALLDRQRALLAAGDDDQRHLVLDRLDRGIAVGQVGQRPDLVLVGEQQVDRARLEHRHHLGAVRGDAGDVGQGEGDLAAGLVGDRHRPLHRRARPGRAPEIGFEIEDRRAPDLRLVERVGVELVRGAAEGVHRPLRVGSDQDQAAAGRLAAALGRGQELDAERADVVAEDLAELVVGDLADEAGAPAQRRDPRHRVRRRAAAGLPRLAHLRVEPGRAVGVEHLHRALDQTLLRQERIVGGGDHVHHRIADRQHVQARLSHAGLMAGL